MMSMHPYPVLLRRLCALLLVPWLAWAAPAHALQAFESPEAAMEAFGKAVREGDDKALDAMLGQSFRELIPPIGAVLRSRFLTAWDESHAVQREGEQLARVTVGQDGWTLPLPLVARKAGWEFDTKAGLREMRVRRIGRNERHAMQTLLAIADAQREYAEVDRDGDGLLHYADRLGSSPGKRDGLYWPATPGEPPSPLGPALVGADGRSKNPEGYRGYRYKLLPAQGPHASGGTLDYRVRGKLFGGYALIAWPVRHGDTGIASFIINHEGKLYERDLGPDTAKKASATKRFDPGPGWTEVSP